MFLELKDVLVTPEAKAPFSFSLDMSDFDLHGTKPVLEPVVVEGCVTNHASALVLTGSIHSSLSLLCDRCLTPFQKKHSVVLDSLVAAQLEDEEHDEIILLEGTRLNLTEVATTAFLLEMDTKNLCKEDCLGLCSGCGVNLNEGECACTAHSDSPFAALASLLDD